MIAESGDSTGPRNGIEICLKERGRLLWTNLHIRKAATDNMFPIVDNINEAIPIMQI